MKVQNLITQLLEMPPTSEVYFCADLRTNEQRPINDIAYGEDKEGEAVILTPDVSE